MGIHMLLSKKASFAIWSDIRVCSVMRAREVQDPYILPELYMGLYRVNRLPGLIYYVRILGHYTQFLDSQYDISLLSDSYQVHDALTQSDHDIVKDHLLLAYSKTDYFWTANLRVGGSRLN